jgi:hypothetical protein
VALERHCGHAYRSVGMISPLPGREAREGNAGGGGRVGADARFQTAALSGTPAPQVARGGHRLQFRQRWHFAPEGDEEALFPSQQLDPAR